MKTDVKDRFCWKYKIYFKPFFLKLTKVLTLVRSMRLANYFIFFVFCQSVKGQEQKKTRLKDYFSFQVGTALPIGNFSDGYQLGYTTAALFHIHGVGTGAEVQLQAGFQYFIPFDYNGYGPITALPFKVGWQQNIAKGFYCYGRVGTLVVKDQKSVFKGRFSLDGGFLFDLKKVGLDVGYNGWAIENHGGWSNYFTLGLVFPFRKNE